MGVPSGGTECVGENGPFTTARAYATPVAGTSVRHDTAPAEATPVLEADYKFKGNRNSSVAGAPALFDVGPGANTFATENVDGVDRVVLRFPTATGAVSRIRLYNATMTPAQVAALGT